MKQILLLLVVFCLYADLVAQPGIPVLIDSNATEETKHLF